MSVYEWSNVLSAFANALAFFLIFEAFLVRRKSFTTVVYIVGWLCPVSYTHLRAHET